MSVFIILMMFFPGYGPSIFILHVISLLREDVNSNKLTLLLMCGFVAQMVEHRTGIRGGHLFESRFEASSAIDDHSSLSSMLMFS